MHIRPHGPSQPAETISLPLIRFDQVIIPSSSGLD